MKTVYQLIQELSKFPANAPVEFVINDGKYIPVKSVKAIKSVKGADCKRSVLIIAEVEYLY